MVLILILTHPKNISFILCTQISTKNILNFGFKLLSLSQNIKAMQIVTSREFRANQKKYFDLAERGTVFVFRKNARPIVISVADDDDYLSKGELLSIQKGLNDIKNGRTYKMQDGESLTDFLMRKEACTK